MDVTIGNHLFFSICIADLGRIIEERKQVLKSLTSSTQKV